MPAFDALHQQLPDKFSATYKERERPNSARRHTVTATAAEERRRLQQRGTSADFKDPRTGEIIVKPFNLSTD